MTRQKQRKVSSCSERLNWSGKLLTNKGQKVAMKEGSPSLFSYPTYQHEWGDCLFVAKVGHIFCLLSLILETNV